MDIDSKSLSTPWLQVMIVLLSVVGGSLLPFPEMAALGLLVFCVVNVLQVALFTRNGLFWMMWLSVYFLGFDIFGAYNNWSNLQFPAFFR